MARYWSVALASVVLGGAAAAVLLLRTPEAPEAVATPAAAPPPEPAPELDLVPADAAGFAHLRLAELWKNDALGELRKTWEAAGPQAITALKTQFLPDPTTITRATGFVVLGTERKPAPFAILTFSADFKPDEVVKANMPNGKAAQVRGKTVYTDQELALYFPNNRTIVIGSVDGMPAYLAKAPAADGPLAPAIALARKGRPVVASVNVAALPVPPNALADLRLPVDLRPLLKTQTVTLSVDLAADARIDLQANYATAADAADAEKAVRGLIDLGRAELGKARAEFEAKLEKPGKGPRPIDQLPEAAGSVLLIGAMKRLDGFLADPKLVTRAGSELTASVTLPKEFVATYGGFAAVGVGLLLPAVQKVREAAARTSSQNNLKQIGIAVHNYHDVTGAMPQDIKDKNGKPLLSWRVAILPYIEQDALYKQFKLDEPWDSPNNKPLSQVVIKTYLSPGATATTSPDGYGLTSYQGVTGPGAAFDPTAKQLRLADFTDGLSNTILVVETADATPWAKPGGLPFDPKKPVVRPTPVSKNDIVNVLLGDGSVRAIRIKTIDEKTLNALFTRNGGEVIGDY